jgi:hypothetical protein
MVDILNAVLSKGLPAVEAACGSLLTAEISEKQARSINYQLPIAKLPPAKNIDDFQFDGTPFDKTVVNDLAGGGFIAQQRNFVVAGGTGTGKTVAGAWVLATTARRRGVGSNGTALRRGAGASAKPSRNPKS